MVDAIVLAGGNARGLAPVAAKGMVPINGRPMYEYIVETLLSCADIGRICVVLPSEEGTSYIDDRVTIKVASGSLPQVAKAGFECLATKKPVLMLSADVPLVTVEAISDFLLRCAKRDVDIGYPIIRYGEPERRFPGMKRTYVRLREGRFTGGNIMLMNPVVVLKNMDLMEHVYDMRKSPMKLFQILGFPFLVGFFLGMLNIRQMEQRVGDVLKATCAGIETPFIEIGVDVDKESDLKLVVAVLSGGQHE